MGLLLASRAYADEVGYTAAQYLADFSGFASGYSFGLLEARTRLSDDNGNVTPAQIALRGCFKNLNSEDLHQAVRRHIQQHPELLPEAALLAILQTFGEICPASLTGQQ
ncbi:MAG: hypothetical protein ACTHN2_21210 [Nitrobacter sp.]